MRSLEPKSDDSDIFAYVVSLALDVHWSSLTGRC